MSATPRPLPRSAPEDQGVDPAGIAAFVDAIEAHEDIELHSLMLLRHGRVVAEAWWEPYAPDLPHLLYSLSKSFTSTAAGFAVAEGLLDLDAPVVSYFPEFEADITDPRSRSMRVRHIAAMASGHLEEQLHRAIATDPVEPIRGFLLGPPDRDPGTVFAYNQPCTYTLGAIVQRQSGLSLTDYLRPRLFDPLGIEAVGWQQDRTGRDLGFTGLHATTDAIARLGLLYLQGGVWERRQLLDPAWVRLATSVQVANPDEPEVDWQQGYGFQFWMSRHGFRGDGAYGQFCVVLPEHDAVLVTTAATTDMQGILTEAWRHLLPALGDRPAPSVATDLAARLAAARLPVVAGAGEPIAGEWAGVSFSPAGGAEVQASLSSVQLTCDDAGWTLVLVDGGQPLTVGLGTGEWRTNLEATERGRTGVPMAASGAWLAADRLHVDVIFLETPHRLRLELSLSDRRVDLAWATVAMVPGTLHDLRMPR